MHFLQAVKETAYKIHSFFTFPHNIFLLASLLLVLLRNLVGVTNERLIAQLWKMLSSLGMCEVCNLLLLCSFCLLSFLIIADLLTVCCVLFCVCLSWTIVIRAIQGSVSRSHSSSLLSSLTYVNSWSSLFFVSLNLYFRAPSACFLFFF